MTGCGQVDSDQVDQSEIYTSYAGTYSEETSDMKVTASLTVGGQFGSQVWLTDESSLSVDGRPMDADDDILNLIQYRFRTTRSSYDFPDIFRIRYQNEDGMIYENIVDMPAGVDFYLVDQLSRRSGGTLKWKLRHFSGKSESLTFKVEDDYGKDFEIHPYANGSEGSYYLEPHKLDKLKGSTVTIMVCRSRYQNSVDAPEAGGSLRTTYCTRKQSYPITGSTWEGTSNNAPLSSSDSHLREWFSTPSFFARMGQGVFMDIKIETFPMGSFACNCSLIYSEGTREAIIVDPGNDAQALLKEINDRNLIVKKLLHTHAHFDHIGCSKHIKKETGATIHLHKKDDLLYKALPAQAMMFGQAPVTAGKVDQWIEDDEEYSLEDTGLKNFLKSLYTPGHTEGSCCFYTEVQGEPILFSGDTLFNGSIGRTDLPGGSFDVIKKSIKDRIYSLPDETKVVTGHGPMTRVFEEKRTNPFVLG